MSMVPAPILHKLARLRRRELLLRLVWGGARWLAVILGLLLAGALIDLGVDRFQTTPLVLRFLISLVQIGTGGWLLWAWLARPLLHQPTDSELALVVEDKTPSLQHRLISAVQLNQPGSNTEGMSAVMIQAVTREAVEQTGPLDFPGFADHRRLAWAGQVLTPVLLVVLLAFIINPALAWVLFQRQLLAHIDIPRSVYLANESPTVWPMGEEVTLRFRVTGPGWNRDSEGQVIIRPEGLPAEDYPLTFESCPQEGVAYFTARIPPSSKSFSFTAYLVDGRTPDPGRLRYEPRPVIVALQAWVLLPKFCGLRPNGQPYGQEQTRGEIVGLAGSQARVRIRTQKPIQKATLEILGIRPAKKAEGEANAVAPGVSPVASAPGDQAEVPLARFSMNLEKDQQTAEVVFPLPDHGTAYRITVLDEIGFENVPPLRRGLRAVPEEPPQVTLLPEQFLPETGLRLGPTEDFEVDGMPLPPGGRIRVAYTASGPYGLGRAELHYRVLRKAEGSSESGMEEIITDWKKLPLIEVAATEKSGPFDLRHGVFVHSKDDEQIQFHAVPSPDPDRILGRTAGGGRFDFETRGIPDGKGGVLELRPGDQIELYVQVYADKDPKSNRPFARSESRKKTVVSIVDFARWIDETLQEERRIRQLESKQRGVFGGP